jgi:hypothetical protein
VKSQTLHEKTEDYIFSTYSLKIVQETTQEWARYMPLRLEKVYVTIKGMFDTKGFE